MSAVLDAQLLASVFVTLFVIMDPPGTVPVFLALTSTMTSRQRRRAARQAIAVAFGVIVVFALFGKQVLEYMHISLPALQASGGLLLLLVAMELLTGRMEEPQPSETGTVNVALVAPLGTVTVAGTTSVAAAGTIVTAGPAVWLAGARPNSASPMASTAEAASDAAKSATRVIMERCPPGGFVWRQDQRCPGRCD